jgi:hypothetical protein
VGHAYRDGISSDSTAKELSQRLARVAIECPLVAVLDDDSAEASNGRWCRAPLVKVGTKGRLTSRTRQGRQRR